MTQTHPFADASAQKAVHRGHSFLRISRPQLAIGAVAFTAAMMSMPTLPASADIIQTEAFVSTLQSFRASSAPLPEVERADYSISYYSVVQSPVPPGTGISSGFGRRAAPCATCSTVHEGVDYHLSAGVPVLAIADGVVTEVGNGSTNNMGVYLKIQHSVDGVTVTSTYAHMQIGSMPFHVGDTVARGAQVGRVGSTGQSTGAHLYFEIRLGGQFDRAVNPVPWLAAHVNV